MFSNIKTITVVAIVALIVGIGTTYLQGRDERVRREALIEQQQEEILDLQLNIGRLKGEKIYADSTHTVERDSLERVIKASLVVADRTGEDVDSIFGLLRETVSVSIRPTIQAVEERHRAQVGALRSVIKAQEREISLLTTRLQVSELLIAAQDSVIDLQEQVNETLVAGPSFTEKLAVDFGPPLAAGVMTYAFTEDFVAAGVTAVVAYGVKKLLD